MKKTSGNIIILPMCTGDNTEKIWVHRFLTKPKAIAAGGLVGAVKGSLVKAWVRSPRTIFFRIKHVKIVRVNLG